MAGDYIVCHDNADSYTYIVEPAHHFDELMPLKKIDLGVYAVLGSLNSTNIPTKNNQVSNVVVWEIPYVLLCIFCVYLYPYGINVYITLMVSSHDNADELMIQTVR